MEIVPLQEQHLEDASELFTSCYRKETELIPLLPARHEQGDEVAALLRNLLRDAPGVAAFQEGRLGGYLIGLPIHAFQGSGRGAFCPIWAHAAVGDDRAEVYRQMYREIAGKWLEAGCLTHAITLYAHDDEAIDVWFRNCFGLLVVDALRSLDPLPSLAPSEGIRISQASADDLDALLLLVEELDRYLADSPIFLPLVEPVRRTRLASWLAEPAHILWIAWHGGEAVGYMRSQPPTIGVAYVVSDPKTISISGAFVRQSWRGKGIATKLLERIVEWARENGYERCAVDFESQNIYGSRFWLGHFQPVCYSLVRHLDDRITWAHAHRSTDSMW